MKYTSLALALVTFTMLGGCAANEPEPSASSSDALTGGASGSAGVCGPVLFAGTGSAPERAVAYEAAEKDARRLCRETPSFCGVDCEAAPVTDAECAPLAVQSDDGQITAVTWSCEVTIAASGPAPKPRCDVAVRCAPGYHAVDTDGDGCFDTCQPDVCATAIRCAPGYVGVDTDGDGCSDVCQPE